MSSVWAWSKSANSREIVRYVWLVVIGLSLVAMIAATMTDATPNLGAVLSVPIAIGLARDRTWAFRWTRFVNGALLVVLPVAVVAYLGWPETTTVNFFGWRVSSPSGLWFSTSLAAVAFLGIWTIRAFDDTTDRSSQVPLSAP